MTTAIRECIAGSPLVRNLIRSFPLSATLLISAVNRRRIQRARAWLQSRSAGQEVLIIASSLDAANELARGAILLEQNDEWAVQRARYVTLETIAPISSSACQPWRPDLPSYAGASWWPSSVTPPYGTRPLRKRPGFFEVPLKANVASVGFSGDPSRAVDAPTDRPQASSPGWRDHTHVSLVAVLVILAAPNPVGMPGADVLGLSLGDAHRG